MTELFISVLNRSIAATWLVLVVICLRLLLCKAPRWLPVLLWGIVAVRLLCPITVESALSLIPSAQTVSPEIMLDTTPQITSGISSVDSVINPMIADSNMPAVGASINPLQIRFAVDANIWLLGVLAMLAYTAISYWHLCRKVAAAIRLRDNIFRSEAVDSPFVLGLLRPRIYLPNSVEPSQTFHVIAHEQTHIRRKDHWWKPLGFLLLAVHWFNPVMWLAYILLCRDIELACDERVIRDLLPQQRADYSQALLTCSIRRHTIAACPLAFGEVSVRQRVKNVLSYRKPAFWLVIAAVILCIAVAVCFLTDPAAPAQDRMLYVQQLLYRNPQLMGDFPADSICYRLSGDMELFVRENPDADKWARLGQLEEEDLLTPGYDPWFRNWMIASSITEELREDYARVWRLDVNPEGAAGLFYVFMEMEDGASYLLCGYDANGSGSASSVHWAARLTDAQFADLRHMLMVDGMLYLDTGKVMAGEVDPSAIVGSVQSTVSSVQRPTENGQSNFGFVGASYARVAEGIVVLIDHEWTLFAPDPDTLIKYHLTVAQEGVTEIRISAPGISGGIVNAEGGPFQMGEQVHLEQLDGKTDLGGVMVKAFSEDGRELLSLTIPNTPEPITAITADGWLLTSNLPGQRAAIDFNLTEPEAMVPAETGK